MYATYVTYELPQGKPYRYFYGYTGFAFGAKAGPWAPPDTPAVNLNLNLNLNLNPKS